MDGLFLLELFDVFGHALVFLQDEGGVALLAQHQQGSRGKDDDHDDYHLFLAHLGQCALLLNGLGLVLVVVGDLGDGTLFLVVAEGILQRVELPEGGDGLVASPRLVVGLCHLAVELAEIIIRFLPQVDDVGTNAVPKADDVVPSAGLGQILHGMKIVVTERILGLEKVAVAGFSLLLPSGAQEKNGLVNIDVGLPPWVGSGERAALRGL